MIEKVVLDYLTEHLDVPVYMEVPANPPETFVIVEKVGSSVENLIYSSLFDIQSYAETLYKAASLNEEVKQAMDNLIELDEIGKSELNSDYYYPSTTTKQYRYQAAYDIYHY